MELELVPLELPSVRFTKHLSHMSRLFDVEHCTVSTSRQVSKAMKQAGKHLRGPRQPMLYARIIRVERPELVCLAQRWCILLSF